MAKFTVFVFNCHLSIVYHINTKKATPDNYSSVAFPTIYGDEGVRNLPLQVL
ncbi:hypothetical protein HMPREF3210_00583 [Lactobacillus gasseri]|nr:hypothetical protein HMPREF3210_00583 [Lactobacillus gasseri]